MIADSEFRGRRPRDHLDSVRTPTDMLHVDDDGDLAIDGVKADELLRRFGSPLYAASEHTVRANFRRISKAFSDRWPARVVVMYAIKANNNPAIRAIIHQEGGGGDCFGRGELLATFQGGADPDTIAMNGSDKSEDDLAAAIDHGVVVNIDAVDEIGMLQALCARKGARARVCVRIKSAPDALREAPSDYMGLTTDAQSFLKREKWGFSAAAAADVVTQALAAPNLSLCGFNLHTPRFTQDPALFAACTRDFADVIVKIRGETGFVPQIIDIGGGWPRERDPESRRYDLNPHSIESFAEHVTGSLLSVFSAHDLPVPELRLEPGRYIVGNAVTLLGRVGAIKRDCGMTWVNVDVSTNNLLRIDTAGSRYHVLAASGMDRPYVERAQIVGPTCIDSRLADECPVPAFRRGDPIAVLDAGMYAESTATQFNSVPRPATVLIADGAAEVIRERETYEDVYGKTRIPDRLKLREERT